MTVLIFANGELNETEWLESRMAEATAIIAADGGLRHILAQGRLPDVLIGDMDSLPADIADSLPQTAIEIVTHPHDKNETDLELALLYAVDKYLDPIEIYGAVGGRLDQTLANISLLAHPALAGREVRLVEPREVVWLVSKATEIVGKVGDTVSLVPVGDAVVVRQTTGLRWPLHNETLAFGYTRGISNEMLSAMATVEMASGQLICVHMTRRGSNPNS